VLFHKKTVEKNLFGVKILIRNEKKNKKKNFEVYRRMIYGFDNVKGMMIENKEKRIIIRNTDLQTFRSGRDIEALFIL